MRWRYHDPKNSQEAAERARVIEQIDSWWREFEKKQGDISALFQRKAEWDLAGWMEQHLQGIDKDIMWEFGPPVLKSGHRLVMTPESYHGLRPLVREILSRAPELDNWEFFGYRLAESLEMAKHSVEGRTGRDLSDFQVKVSKDEHNRIDLTYTAPSIRRIDDTDSLHAAFVATESLLGEDCLNRWIGVIEAVPTPKEKWSLFSRNTRKTTQFYGLDRLHDTVHALIGAIHDQLPQAPHYEWVEEAKWTLWEFRPEASDDYFDQADLIVAKSPNPAQWTAVHGGGYFYSGRFTSTHETFCYLKIDGAEGLGEAGFQDKSEIEDSLDEALKPAKLGCQIGGGTGLRYSYIELALTDIDRSIPVIRKLLQEGNLPKRSWILFHDTDLSAEWVGIYDDSPAPPLQVNS